MKPRKFFQPLLFFALMVVAGGFSAKAQETEYHPFADLAVWSVNNIKYATCGDTAICGKDYLKVYRQEEDHPFDFDIQQAEYFCAIRNDTSAQRVYGIYKEPTTVYYSTSDTPDLQYYLSTDTTEFLLYDFALLNDDTVTVASFDDIYNAYVHPGIYLYRVAPFHNEYDYTIMLNDSSTRKVMNMQALAVPYYNDYIYMEWIEGIGSVSGTFTVSQGGFFDVWESSLLELICFMQDGNLLLSRPQADYDGVQDCFSIGNTGVKDNTSPQSNIYPNPTSGKVSISLPESWGERASQISVYNVNGQRVLAKSVETQPIEINLQDLPNGMYMVQIICDNKQVISKKIIKQ
ncbi:MAG: T9SS type A sorting domain-containing protein [Bacteroidales bacterium]|nr:T9SS type A sorting domain-containing protein [Bacteroidales bacterium]